MTVPEQLRAAASVVGNPPRELGLSARERKGRQAAARTLRGIAKGMVQRPADGQPAAIELNEAMAELNRARDEALKEISA